MLHKFALALLILAALSAPSGAARAADPCPALRTQGGAADTATRIAAAACLENLQWFRPFIDTQGRLASASVSEAETSRLEDGATETWRRTASYWRDTGLLQRMGGFAGAEQCFDPYGSGYSTVACRAFLIDNPWSAAFVSYVMMKAGVRGFRPSASHYDYVRDAYRAQDQSPFLYLDPASSTAAPGDLLCAVRSSNRVYGYQGLIAALDGGNGGLNMHCDVVVGVNPNNDGKAYLIGGNVQQGATMRLMAVNRNNQFWPLPLRSETQVECSPDTVAACDMNKLDWAVLLKLKPEAALAQLAPPTPLFAPQQAPASAQPSGCCVQCVLGSNVPRCPNPNAPGIKPQTQD
ncbi:DUF2272 domain-containing protein [Lysobacter gummosus]|uniref:DUF2272 domain-containing protein n=1 Tax=Lysobacter gummosus TaxID=262324 RepID=A0ABY3X7C2_9GAMM|nr:DUF2272 domain-containing protein [Lysobacter gummosus]ALN91847.1 hypothetical protein LG3211_2883 [Lysobacter gummosus]UNP27510.1 DUF2272 domain-containing protein [Lysobacter gummosus]